MSRALTWRRSWLQYDLRASRERSLTAAGILSDVALVVVASRTTGLVLTRTVDMALTRTVDMARLRTVRTTDIGATEWTLILLRTRDNQTSLVERLDIGGIAWVSLRFSISLHQIRLHFKYMEYFFAHEPSAGVVKVSTALQREQPFPKVQKRAKTAHRQCRTWICLIPPVCRSADLHLLPMLITVHLLRQTHPVLVRLRQLLRELHRL